MRIEVMMIVKYNDDVYHDDDTVVMVTLDCFMSQGGDD